MNNFMYSQINSTNEDDGNVLALAQTLYGEFAGVKDLQEKKEYMVHGGSSALNAQEYGGEWAGQDFKDLLHNRFYAAQNMNQPFREALEGKFPNKDAEDSWKMAMQVSYGLLTGKINKTDTLFYITDDEEKTASIDFKQLKKTGRVGKYNTYTYKDADKVYETKRVQSKLNSLGYDSGEVDGRYGPMTKKAVRQFQKDRNLKVDGIVGEQTLTALFE